MLRSILAVAAGFVTIAVLSFGTDAALRTLLPGAVDATGRMASGPLLGLTLAYVAVYAVAGCYLAARLAPNAPMRHALVLGVLGLLFTLAATAATWSLAPAWYHGVSLAVVMPYAWLGGLLRERELAGRAGAELA